MVAGRGHKLGDWMCAEEQAGSVRQRDLLPRLDTSANAGTLLGLKCN